MGPSPYRRDSAGPSAPGYSQADHIAADRIAGDIVVAERIAVVDTAGDIVVADTAVAERIVAADRTVVDIVSAHIVAVDRAGIVVAGRDCSAPGLADYRPALLERTDDRNYCKNVYRGRFHCRKLGR